MAPHRSLTSRLLRGLVITLLVVAVLLYIGLPVGMAVYALLPSRQSPGATPDGFDDVTLTAADGVSLQAWYRPPENGAAIILLHGAGSSRQSVLPFAAMLARHGYGVLAVDLRGHGASGGKTNRLGWQGSRDVGAAVAFLQSRSEVQSIGGLGISMGGEALLGAAAEYPVIQAIAADGATRRSTKELLALPSERPLVRSFTARVMFAAVQLISREAPPRPILDSMYAARTTRFLLVAAGRNELETAFNRLFAVILGGRASLWVVPGVEHTGAFSRYPQEYEQRLIEFFDAALLAAKTRD